MRIYTGIIQTLQAFIMYTNYVTVHCRVIPLLFASPFLHSLLLPISLSLLTWNPPFCDRIRPPHSQVAHELIFPFPSPCSFTPHSKIPTPRGLPDPNYTFIRTTSWTWLTRSSTITSSFLFSSTLSSYHILPSSCHFSLLLSFPLSLCSWRLVSNKKILFPPFKGVLSVTLRYYFLFLSVLFYSPSFTFWFLLSFVSLLPWNFLCLKDSLTKNTKVISVYLC